VAGIEIRNIAKRFDGNLVLADIDLAVADQEFLVLLGASGCGKTTLLRIIAGLEVPMHGEVRIGGRRVNELAPRSRGIAMVFQQYAVFPHLTVFENIAFGLRMKKLAKDAIDARVRKAAGLMHIEGLLARYPGQLSGGQRQRVAVARALAMEPEVLLMDEPLSNLDALLRMEMRAELKALLKETRTTTIYVTHDQVEAMSLADRIAIMDEGRLVQVADPIEIYRNPATRYIGGFIGSPPMNFLPAARQDGTWEVAGFRVAGPRVDRPELVFGIRPEDVHLADAGLSAAVRVVEPLGAHQLVTATVGDQLFRIVLDSDVKIVSGDALIIAPRTGRARWFDANTGVAIPWSEEGA